MTRNLRIALSLVVLLAFFAGQAASQRVATQKRGAAASTSFTEADLEQISLFSGAMTLGLELGVPYPTGPNFSYQFRVVLNSSIWDHEPVICAEGDYSYPIPDDRYNLGHSAALHLGRITWAESHYKYWSADGAEVGLYSALHPGSPTFANVYHSTNSSYMRFRRFPNGSAQCQTTASTNQECGLLEFPDGGQHEFVPKTIDGDIVYLPTRISDAFGNDVEIAYPAAGTSWEISDIHGRSHEILFAGPAGEYRRITQVRLAKFGGGQATYSFQYASKTLERQGFSPPLCSSRSSTVTVNALTRIVLPGGEFYEFDYYLSDDDPGPVLSGAISAIRLRTGGEVRYTYAQLLIPSQIADPLPTPLPGPGDPPLQKAYGVATVERADSVGGAAVSTWTYDYDANLGVTIPGEPMVPCSRTTTVTDPLGNQTVHHHTTSVRHRWSYSLPFTRCEGGTYANTPPFLSTEIYAGSVATGTKLRSTYVEYTSDGLFVGNGAQTQEHNQRLVYRKTVFHDDEDRESWIQLSDFDGLGNFRTQTMGGTFTPQDSKTVTTRFNPSAGTLMVDPENGTTTGSTFVMPTATDRWLHTTYDQKQTASAGATSTSEYCFSSDGFLERVRVLAGTSRAAKDVVQVFESDLGFIASEKRYGGDDQASMDGVYGSLCNMTLPTLAKNHTEHTYSAGIRATSDAMDPCDGGAFLSLADRTIDSNTGLVSSARTAAGVETSYSHDAIGRLVLENPSQTASTIYAFSLSTQANPTRPPQLAILQCATNSCTTSNALSWSRLDYDGLGRAFQETSPIPTASGITEMSRVTTFDAAGNIESRSMWGSTSLAVTFSAYDPFGRPGSVTLPGQPSTVFTYHGDRLKTVKTRVQASGGLIDAFTTEGMDVQGRITFVCEGQSSVWSGGCTGVETGYLYDVGSRLTRVCSSQQGAACGQIRRFLYDHRGFLTQERHPEVGVNSTRNPAEEPPTIIDSDGLEEIDLAADIGNDWIYYTRNALGHVLTKTHQGSTQFDLAFHYDPAGRIVRVDESNNGNPRPLKEYFYGRVNSGSDFRAGQLVQTRRHNWVDIVGPLAPTANPGSLNALITETFKYEGLGGLVSARQTRFTFNGDTYAFDVSQSYDALRNVASITYPQCRHTQGGCSTAAPVRTIANSYTSGYLTRVSGYATSVAYQSGGMLHQIEHSNGVTYTVEVDASTGIPRPHRISTQKGASTTWNTGIYSYDGAGNIATIGTQSFRYDRRNRMLSGQAKVGSVNRTQTAAYDNYGNLTSLTTNGSTQALAVDASSNRLSGLSASYDGAGNLTDINYGSERYEYEYDAANMVKHLRSNQDLARIYLYNASDERIAQFQCVAGVCQTNEAIEIWTLRGLDNRVLRTYHHPWGGGWIWKDDAVYASQGHVLAQVKPNETLHVHPDHLGTPRLITNAAGNQVALHSYYPFGQEATATSQSLSLKFTGHERDALGAKGQLDYMHARYCSPTLARFTTVDPARTGRPSDPQTWNRYVYGRNNPIRLTDPDGQIAETGWDFFNVATGVASLVANIASGNAPGALLDVGTITIDVLATALPGLPAGASTTSKAYRAAQLARNKVIGEATEKTILAAANLNKNRKKFDVTKKGKTVSRFPDAMEKGLVVEIKAGAIGSRGTHQVLDSVAEAKANGVKAILFVKEGTKIPKKLKDKVKNGDLIIVQFVQDVRLVE